MLFPRLDLRPFLVGCVISGLGVYAARAQPAASPYAARPVQTCVPDIAERERLMTLDVATFDRSDSGWRPYATAHCYFEAAQLISDYLDGRQTLKADDQSILRYHSGQMLADANRTDDAIAALRTVLALEPQRPHPDQGWTLYIQGTLDFLQQDRPGLDKTAATLATYAGGETGQTQAGDQLNLNALHGLQRCFGRGYVFAYSSPDCRDFDEAAKLNKRLDAVS